MSQPLPARRRAARSASGRRSAGRGALYIWPVINRAAERPDGDRRRSLHDRSHRSRRAGRRARAIPKRRTGPTSRSAQKPAWIRVRAPGSPPGYAATNRIVREHKLVTVCEEARCPNIGECWEKKHATFHDHGRDLHPRLRLLQRAHRAAGGARRRRARRASPTRSPSSASPMSSSPRSIATTSPTAAPSISPAPSPRSAPLRRRRRSRC